jgi:hypothetical protein
VDDRQRKIGLNEALFREINERVRGISEGFGEPLEEAQFVCECGDDLCMERMRLSLRDYERVRSAGDLFVVVPGHETENVESVVELHDTWAIVRKRAGAPAELAEQTDPRG